MYKTNISVVVLALLLVVFTSEVDHLSVTRILSGHSHGFASVLFDLLSPDNVLQFVQLFFKHRNSFFEGHVV